MKKPVSEKEYDVAGYRFKSKEAAQDAKDELNAIKYMMKKTNKKDPAQVYVLYNTILDKELFKTQVGMDYLKELQQFLYINKDIPNDKIRPIPISQDLQTMIDGRRETIKNKDTVRLLERKYEHQKDMFIRSMILNIMFAIAIAIMVYIAMSGSNVNVINYENKLQDKYASWQEELESREAVIKDKEASLSIK